MVFPMREICSAVSSRLSATTRAICWAGMDRDSEKAGFATPRESMTGPFISTAHPSMTSREGRISFHCFRNA